MIEFFLILRAIGNAPGGIFWRLMIGTLVMLVPGYMGEAGYMNVTLGFVIGMAGWFYILYEIFAGEASKMAANEAPPAVQSSFSTMRWVVTVGWAIYPLGYVLGYFVYVDDAGVTTAAASQALNIVYNLADVVNKIAFGLLIWYAATTESKGSAQAAYCIVCGRLVRPQLSKLSERSDEQSLYHFIASGRATAK